MTRRATRTLATLAATAALGIGAARAQISPPTFETGIEIINLNLSVTDAAENYVTDLDQPDFAVYEDGIRQDLSLFTHENLPISMVIMVDTSASMEEKITVAQQAAIRFIKTLRPVDLAQIVQFNDRTTTLEPFTNDLQALEAAILATDTSGPTALHNALYIALKDLERESRSQPAPPARGGAALRRRGHRVAGERRPGAGAGQEERDQPVRDQPAPQPPPGPPAPGLQPGRVPAHRPARERPGDASTSRPR